MNINLNPWSNNTPPDFVNEDGVKWWLDKSTTWYATKKDITGVSLNATCYFVETVAGTRTRVLVCNDTNKIIEEYQELEALAVAIDVRKFLIHTDE